MRTIFQFIHRQSLPLVLFTIIGFIVFGNILQNGFVWLDYPYIIDNPQTKNASLLQLFESHALTGNENYRPITAVYYVLLYRLFGEQAGYFHFAQILLRILNTFLIYRLFRIFLKNSYSILLATIYLVHPFNQSQVALISAASDILYMFFGLIAFISYHAFPKKLLFTVFSYFFLLLSLLSKESGILFLPMFFLYGALIDKRHLTRIIFFIALLSFVYISMRYALHGFSAIDKSLYPLGNTPIFERIINIPKILSFYFTKSIIPINFSSIHLWTVTDMTWDDFYAPLVFDFIFLSVFACIGIYIYVKQRSFISGYIFFGTMFVSGLLLYSHIIPLDYTVAGRWYAFSMLGSMGMIGTYAQTIYLPIKFKRIAIALCCFILVLFSVQTFIKNLYRKDNLSLFTRYAEIENNYLIEAYLASTYLEKNTPEKAVEHALRSLEMFEFDNNLMILGLAYEKLGRLTQAEEVMKKAIDANNYNHGYHAYSTYTNIVHFTIRTKQPELSFRILTQAVEDYPEDSYFWTMLAATAYLRGDKAKAIEAIHTAQRLDGINPNVTKYYDLIINGTL